MKQLKPMLSAKTDENRLKQYFDEGGIGLLASPKLDGIRALNFQGQLFSRSLKPIPNRHAQLVFANQHWMDGELIAGEPNAPDVYNKTFRAVMAIEPVEHLTFWVFDKFENPELPFVDRMRGVQGCDLTGAKVPDRNLSGGQVRVLPQRILRSFAEILAFEEQMLDQGFEGMMLRRPDGLYKFNRSTAKELFLMKIKRDTDETAEIIEVLERMHNGNEAFVNELGRTARSSHQDNKEGLNTAGAWLIRWNGMVFKCALGQFDAVQAQDIWDRRDEIVRDNLLDFRFFGYGNFKDGKPGAPRHPRGIRLRSKLDQS